MKTNSKGIFFTANEREKERIKKNAALCGLKQGEYIRQRTLGYAPKAVLPGVFFHFCEKLDRLCELPFSKEVNDKAVALLAEMEKEFLRPQKEQVNEGETLWQPPASGP